MFLAHLVVARELKLPLFLHVRDAHDLFYDLFTKSEFYRDTQLPFLMHCFTGEAREMRRYLRDFPKSRLSLSLSGGGLCKPGSDYLRKALAVMASEIGKEELLSRLMIETDAPYQGFRGCAEATGGSRKTTFPNPPSSLIHVVSALSEALGSGVEEVARVTHENARRFFEC